MAQNLSEDLETSHKLLNYGFACYQGVFAALHMLSELGYHEFNPDELSKAQANLNSLDNWKKALWQGIPLFSKSWKGPQTSDAREALALITKLKSDLNAAASKIEKCAATPELSFQPDVVRYLISSLARLAYTNEHLVKGTIDFGDTFAIPEIRRTHEGSLPRLTQAIETSHMFFDIFMGENPPEQIFYQGLVEEVMFVPGALRTYAHEITHLTSLFKGEFTFELAEIPQAEAMEWAKHKIPPFAAGYWRAYGLMPKDIFEWSPLGLQNPQAVWFWKVQGFTAEKARAWLEAGFYPPTARMWNDAKYSVHEAVDAIERGVKSPEELRKI